MKKEASMTRDHKEAIARANEQIRRNRQARKHSQKPNADATQNRSFETLNCANAFAKNGKNLEHLFDKLF